MHTVKASTDINPEGLPSPEASSLRSEVQDLIAKAKRMGETEAAFQKARAKYAGGVSAKIALLICAGFVFAFFTLMALILGLLLSLSSLWGPWIAMAVVVLALFIGSILCFGCALSKFRRMRSTLNAVGAS